MSREVSAAFSSAVRGSNTPLVYVDVWYDSDIIREGAFVVGGNVKWDSRNAVEDSVSLTVVDRDSSGSRLRDIIHSYGCRVNVRAGFDLAGTPELVSLGWFDITSTDAVEEWAWYDWRADAMKLSSVVKIEAQGLMSLVAKSGLFVPKQPVTTDAWAAAAELCLDVVSVLDPGFTPTALPSGASAIVFDQDRLKALRNIAGLWDAKPVITDLGQMTFVIPDAGDVTDDYGLQINIEQWRNETTSDDLYNGVRFTGKTPEGLDLVGYWQEPSGPLAWGGPFGRRPKFMSSPLMTTQSMVNTAAATAGENMKAARSATQTVKALWNPAQQVRDRPVLKLPDRDVDSEILAISLPLPGANSGGAMDVTLRLPLYLEA